MAPHFEREMLIMQVREMQRHLSRVGIQSVRGSPFDEMPATLEALKFFW